MKAHRQVTHRDGSLEGDVDPDADAGDVDKEAQRDLTSMARPPRDTATGRREPDRSS